MEKYKRAFKFASSHLTKPVNYLALSRDGSLLAICSDDHVVHIISIGSKGEDYAVVKTRGGPMAAAVWLPDGRGGHWLVMGGHQGLLRLVYIKFVERKLSVVDETAPLTLGGDEIVDLVLDPPGRCLAVVSLYRIFVVSVEPDSHVPLRLREQYPPADQPKEESRLSGAAFCDSGSTLIVSHLDARVLRLYDLIHWPTIRDLHVTFKPISLTWVTEHQCILVYCIDTMAVKALALENGQLVYRRTFRSSAPNRSRYCRQVRSAQYGRLVICGSDLGTLMFWDISTGMQLPGSLQHGPGQTDAVGGMPGLQTISSVTCSHGNHLVVGSNYSDSPTVVVWSTDPIIKNGSSIACFALCVTVFTCVVVGPLLYYNGELATYFYHAYRRLLIGDAAEFAWASICAKMATTLPAGFCA